MSTPPTDNKLLGMDPAIARPLTVFATVILFGTAGYTWVEGWSPWQSLFFTLITLTTVGYGDYGISEHGERFTAILMIGGIGAVSYSLSQFIQYATAKAMHPEQRMRNKAAQLSDHCIVCGIGRTGCRVTDRLTAEGMPCVGIDTNEELINDARGRNRLVIRGDATCDRVLTDAGIERAKSVIVVTSNDSANAMICLSARALAPGVDIIARAEGQSAVQKLRRAGASSVINPTAYGGDSIAESILRPGIARMLYTTDNDGTAPLRFVEVEITRKSPHCGRPLAEVGAEHPTLAFVATRTGANAPFKARPNPHEPLLEGQVLLVAGEQCAVDALSPRQTSKAA